MPRTFPEFDDDDARWDAPRGERWGGGEWEYELGERRFVSSVDGEYETAAAQRYAALIERFKARMWEFGWSQREVARRSGLAQAVVSKALSGSVWPRWSTLTRLAAALGLRIEVAGQPGVDPLDACFAFLDAERELTGAYAAQGIGVRPNTFYDLRKRGREPRSSTVLAFVAWCELDVVGAPVDMPEEHAET